MKQILDTGPFPSVPWVYSQLSSSLDGLHYLALGGRSGELQSFSVSSFTCWSTLQQCLWAKPKWVLLISLQRRWYSGRSWKEWLQNCKSWWWRKNCIFPLNTAQSLLFIFHFEWEKEKSNSVICFFFLNVCVFWGKGLEVNKLNCSITIY